MKTLKQIANALGIDKQKVYRYVKKHNIKEAHQDASISYYDESAEAQINKYFSERSVPNEAHRSTSKHIKVLQLIRLFRR